MSDAVWHGPITKIEPEQRRFWGWAYQHKNSDGEQVVDHSGDTVDTPEAVAAFSEAFSDFVKHYRQGDDRHQTFGAATLIEAAELNPDKLRAIGYDIVKGPSGWFVGFEANPGDDGDRLWEGVKDGRRMLSIVGAGMREPI